MPETDDTTRTDETTRRSRGDVLARVLSYLVAVTTILGIPIGLYGYYASQQANRVNRTFDFYRDFRGDGLQKDFGLLVTRWNEKSVQVDRLLKNDDFAGLSRLAASLLQTDETQTALSRLVLFFDEAYSCVDKALCDNNAAFALLQNPADQNFFHVWIVSGDHPAATSELRRRHRESPRAHQDVVIALRRFARRPPHGAALAPGQGPLRITPSRSEWSEFSSEFYRFHRVAVRMCQHRTRCISAARESKS